MTTDIGRISRRAFAGGALAGLAAGPSALALTLTGRSPTGPFYPVSFPADADADLTWVNGRATRAKGRVIEVTGRLLDRLGNPLRGARLELWQANAAGRYDHPGEQSKHPLDPDFQSYGSLRTGADGEWKVTTIKPAGYDSPLGHRTPHIHFIAHGGGEPLVAQMYFPEEAEANGHDRLYRGLGEAARTSVASAAGESRYRWDIVLMDG